MYDWSRVVSAGVGPIIVISACGLLCLAFYNRMAAVVTRLRGFHRERLHAHDLLRKAQSSTPPDDETIFRQRELIGMLQVQMRHVAGRAQWIRRTLVCLLFTIALLALCSLCIGLAVLYPAFGYAAMWLFVCGLLLLILGVVFALIELRRALDPVDLEARFVQTALDEVRGV